MEFNTGYLLIIVFLLLFSGCGSQGPLTHLSHPRNGKKELPLEASWKIGELINNNAMHNIGVTSEGLYYIRDKGSTFEMVFTDLAGEEISSYEIPKGKGPGEVQSPMQVTIGDTFTIIYDIEMLKFTLYSPKGEFLEDVMMDPEQGIPFFHQQNGETFLYSGLLSVQYGQGRITDGKVETLRKVEYNEKYKGLEELNTKKMRMTIPLVSEGKIFSLVSQDSLRLSRLDDDFKEDKVYVNLSGSLLSFRVVADSKHLYFPFPFDFDKAQSTGKLKTEFAVAVFDKENGEHLYTISGPVSQFEGMLSAVGVVNGNLILLADDNSGSLSEALGEKGPGKRILVYRLPE